MRRLARRSSRPPRRARSSGYGIPISVLAVAALLWAAHAAQAQEPTETVMIAAGEWVAERVPGGVTRLDPHRSGAGIDGERLQRVARALGASLVNLEEARRCDDIMDPASCRFSGGPLIAIALPRVQGDQATVKVYCWHGDDSPRRPVAERSWDLVLRRSGGGWRVVSGGGA